MGYPDSVGAQAVDPSPDTVWVRDQVTCSGCSIRLDAVARLGRSGDQSRIQPSGPVTVGRNSQGHFYVAPMTDFQSVGIYDASGQQIRVIDRRVLPVGLVAEVRVLSGDSVIVVDRRRRVATVLANDRTVLRTIDLGITVEGFYPVPDGRFVSHWRSSSPSLIGLSVHIHRSDGAIQRSFGARERTQSGPVHQNRQLALVPSGVLVARSNRWQIEEWTLDGEQGRTFIADRPWFAPWSTRASEDQPRRPWLESIRADSSGKVWAVVHVAEEDYFERAGSGGDAAPGASTENTTPVARESREDTIVEVIDVATGELIARSRLDGLYYGYLNGNQNLYARHAFSESGGHVLEVWRMELDAPPTQGG